MILLVTLYVTVLAWAILGGSSGRILEHMLKQGCAEAGNHE